MQEAADLAGAVELRALLLEAADAQHLPQQGAHVRGVVLEAASFGVIVIPFSSVEVSPSGSPSSRALSRRRMILPLRVCGRRRRKSISFGATAGAEPLAGEAEQLRAQRLARLGSRPSARRTP